MFVIRIIGAAGHAPAPPEAGPWYVVSYDPDFNGGHGELVSTHDIEKAQRFADSADAYALWRQQSKVMPLRPDGRPNRPLTAFTVSVEEVL